MSDATTAVKVEDVSPVKKRLSFDVPWQDVKNEMDAVYRKVNRTVNVRGFRKGKVPRNILENLYQESVKEETVTNLIERLYPEALRKNELFAACRPDIEQHGIEEEKDFTFIATVEVEPVIEPQGYTELVLEKRVQEVTDEEVADKLVEYRQRLATLEDIKEERPVQEGDTIILDFSGFIDGIARKELSADNFFFDVGAKRFIPGFEEQLVGMTNGETKEIKVRFPEDYHVKEDLAGKEASFTVTVKGIKEQKLPPLDESFVANFAEFKSLDELKADIRQKLQEFKDTRAQNELQEAIVSELLKENEFEVPDCYVEREYQYLLADVGRKMAMEGLPSDKAGEIQAKYEDQYRQAALRMVKVSSLLNSIARKESLHATENEVKARIEEIAAQSRDHEAMQKYFSERAVIAGLIGEISNKKVLKFIEESAKITTVKEGATLVGEAG